MVPLGLGYVANVRSRWAASSMSRITRLGHSDTVAMVVFVQVPVLSIASSWISGCAALLNDVLTAAKTRPPEASSHLRFMWSSPVLAPITAATGALHAVLVAPSSWTLQ